MKLAYNIRFLVFLLVVASCSLSKRQTTDEVDISGSHKIDLIVLDPGHFHASLLQKETLTDVSDTIRIYAPEGIAVNQYLESIDSYNQRAESPTTWKKQVYTGDDYLQKMLADHKGNIVVLVKTIRKRRAISWSLSKPDIMSLPISHWLSIHRISSY